MHPGEELEICDLVLRCFNKFVAPDYPPRGVREFQKYVTPELLRTRSSDNHFTLVAHTINRITGMIEIRDFHHVSLLFVDQSYQRRGISHSLFEEARKICLYHLPEQKRITVNSSPYAVPVYRRLGFHETERKKSVNGITFIPMEYLISDDDS